jgi:hypothetical protein
VNSSPSGCFFSSQQRNNRGVLKHRSSTFRRAPLYQEILEYSYQDYIEKCLVPYYWGYGLDLTPEVMAKAGDLRTYAAGLRANPKIRLIVNQNDFLLADEDLGWLRTTFAPQQMRVFEQGGHWGNLFSPAVQKALLGTLTGLMPAPRQ